MLANFQAFTQKIVREAVKLVVFAIEIGFIDRQRIDEVLDFPVGINAQLRKVCREGKRPCCGHPIKNAPFHVISLGFRKNDSGLAIQKFAETAKFFLGCRNDLVHVDAGEEVRPSSPIRRIATSMA